MANNRKLFSKTRTNLTGWLFMAPSMVFLLSFTIFPIFKTLVQSFFTISMNGKTKKFVGLENYSTVFKDPVFAIVLKNTLKFAAIVIPLSLIIGLALALLLNKKFRGRGIARVAIFYPNVAPVIGFATIWVFLLTPTIGLVDNVVRMLGLPSIDFLNNPKYALFTIMGVYLWREASFIMIFYLSGLQNISQEYYEAAHLDGASRLTVLRKITLPLIMPTTLFALTITMANAFKMVDLTMIMTTRGGPNNSTNLLMHHIYLTAFTYWDQGQAAVLTIVMLGFMTLVACIQFGVIDRRTHYEN
ncbi:MAG: sugar ABC transporter permease [Angelakisella sp.]